MLKEVDMLIDSKGLGEFLNGLSSLVDVSGENEVPLFVVWRGFEVLPVSEEEAFVVFVRPVVGGIEKIGTIYELIG